MDQVSDAEKIGIQKEARRILDNFAKSLAKVKFNKKEKHGGLDGFREEGHGKDGDRDFRQRMFENAPNKSGDVIIAEKKKW
jgi:hypothetical protein